MSTFTSRVWTKPQTQNTIKVLRESGLNVVKLNSGYECKVNDQLIFKAMQGHNGYLVRYVNDLFEAA
jgi:hypothetical protein